MAILAPVSYHHDEAQCDQDRQCDCVGVTGTAHW